MEKGPVYNQEQTKVEAIERKLADSLKPIALALLALIQTQASDTQTAQNTHSIKLDQISKRIKETKSTESRKSISLESKKGLSKDMMIILNKFNANVECNSSGCNISNVKLVDQDGREINNFFVPNTHIVFMHAGYAHYKLYNKYDGSSESIITPTLSIVVTKHTPIKDSNKERIHSILYSFRLTNNKLHGIKYEILIEEYKYPNGVYKFPVLPNMKGEYNVDFFSTPWGVLEVPTKDAHNVIVQLQDVLRNYKQSEEPPDIPENLKKYLIEN